jgi:SAM-dependent methyltransferase
MGASRFRIAVSAGTLGREEQSFLDAAWVRNLLAATPARWQERVALAVLGWSPHYFYRDQQPAGLSRSAFLRRELDRNRGSRRVIGARLLTLTPDDVVLDYGCGPGFMAPYVAGLAKTLYAVDISRGALACARILHGAGNIRYLHTSELDALPVETIDLAYSIAVFQHMTDRALAGALAVIRRALRPGGRLVAHVVIDAAGWRSETEWRQDASVIGRARMRYGLNCFGRREADVGRLVTSAGFTDVQIRPIRELCPEPFADDVYDQHVLTAVRP